MARRRQRLFIPIPPDRTTIWKLTIAGIDVHDFILNASFPHGLISEELICEIELDNNGENFTGKFKARDIIQFSMDFTDGNSIQFKGEVEEVKSKLTGGSFNLGIKGAHFTSQLLDVMVSAEFTNAKISDIRTTIISDNLTGFTTNNIEENTTLIDIKFVNLPLLDCLLALDIEGDEDTYIDFDKDFHTFKKGSKENLVPHVSPEGLLELRGLGTDSAEVRNQVSIIGQAGDLPVIHRSDDATSQTDFRAKEKVITDTTITDESQAQTLGDAEVSLLKDPLNQGSASTLFHLTTSPGDKIYVITGRPHKIHDLFRVVKFVFHVPNETMEFFFNKERSIPKLFKDRIKKDLGQEQSLPASLKGMTRSFLFTFDDQSKIDSTSSSSITVSDSVLFKATGAETGVMVSIEKSSDIEAKEMTLLVNGSELDGATYEFRADSQAEFQTISPNATTSASVTDQGKKITLRIRITSSTTRIDSAGLYWKT